MCKDIKKIITEVNEKYSEVTNLAEELAKIYIKNQKYNELKLSTERDIKKIDDVTIVKIEEYNDLHKLITGTGFYLILSDCECKNNECKLEMKLEDISVKAIYRGHCTQLRNRIQSHLYNKKHNEEQLGSNKYETCMKLEQNSDSTYKQGVNIDDDIYKANVFYVIQHKMNNSKQFMREAMEKEFDDIYNKPIACRD